MAVIGFGYSNIRWFSRYSVRKKALASAASPAPLSAIIRMSPPAQKPRSPAWSISTDFTAGSSRHASSAAVIASHMALFNACSAFGRFRVMRPTPDWTRVRTSGSSIMRAGIGGVAGTVKAQPAGVMLNW
jgi:hypothetical protein